MTNDVDKINDFESYMTGMRRADSNVLIQVNHLPRAVSEDGKRIIISVDNWYKFTSRITGTPVDGDYD